MKEDKRNCNKQREHHAAGSVRASRLGEAALKECFDGAAFPLTYTACGHDGTYILHIHCDNTVPLMFKAAIK